MKLKWKKAAVIAMIAATLGASISALAEEIESRKLAVIQVEGTEAYITKPNGGKHKAVKGMSLGQGNKVSTGKDTYVYITADDDKTFKMDDNSIIAISKASAKTLSVELQDGELFFNVEKPLGADEELSFRAANTSMSIRGTSGWLRYDAMDMEFFLVEGKVTWEIDGEEVVINAGERVVLERDWGGKTPAPGMPLVYKLKEKVPFTWKDLSDDALIAVMENRAKINLAAIGLDAPEKIAEAAAKVEEILEAREPEPEPVYEYVEEYWVENEPKETEATQATGTSNETEATEATGTSKETEATEATQTT